MTIKDYKDNSDNDIEIIVEEKTDECDPMGETLYSGSLGKCPAELNSLTIDSVGQSLGAELEGRVLYYLIHLKTQAK